MNPCLALGATFIQNAGKMLERVGGGARTYRSGLQLIVLRERWEKILISVSDLVCCSPEKRVGGRKRIDNILKRNKRMAFT
jgi:hypothetical protein